MKKAIVVGSGAGGATVAKELQGHYEVTVLEAGKEFKPFGMELEGLEKMRHFGLFFDEREIQFVIPAYKIRRATDEMILVTGIGLGGTTTICTGNALRMDRDLKGMGINLDAEFDEVFSEIPVTPCTSRNGIKSPGDCSRSGGAVPGRRLAGVDPIRTF